MVKDKLTGFTYSPGDTDGLADGIYEVLTGPDLTSNCRQFAESYLEFMLQANRYENLFYELYAYNSGCQEKNGNINNNCFTETTPTVLNMLALKTLNK